MAADRHADTLERLREIARRRGPLAAAVFLSMAGVLGTLVLSLPALYRATAVLIIEPARGGDDLPGELAARLETIQQRLLSREAILARAREFRLYPELAARSLDNAVVAQTKSDTRVTTRATADAAGRSTLVAVNVSYRGRDPQTAAAVCNHLAAFYLEEDHRLRSRRFAGRADLLKRQLDDARQRLDDQERRFGDLRHRPAGAGDELGASDAAAFERLSGRLRAVREERVRTLERRERLIKQLAEADPRGAAAERLARLRQELIERRTRLTEKHPDVLQLQAEVAALEQKAAASAGLAAVEPAGVAQLRETLREVEAELGPMKAEEARLGQELAAHQDRLSRTAHARPLSDVSRDYQAAQESYETLLRRYEEAQLADTAHEALGSRLTWLDRAVPPTGAAGPQRLRLLLMALLASLAAATASAGLAERLDDSIRTVDDLRAFTSLPVLTTVSTLHTAADRRRARLRLVARLAVIAVTVALVSAGAHRLVADGFGLTSALERGQ